MTRLWPEGDPVQVTLSANGLPLAFFWRGVWHSVASVALRWRVRADWWSDEAWREYVKLTTADGLLCTLYRDLNAGTWFCSRLYD
jgi:hypothetical protein